MSQSYIFLKIPVVLGMLLIATVATESEHQVSIYRSRRETPLATIAEIEHERF